MRSLRMRLCMAGRVLPRLGSLERGQAVRLPTPPQPLQISYSRRLCSLSVTIACQRESSRVPAIEPRLGWGRR